MKLKCGKCKYEWDYHGKMRFRATCPDCKANVRITTNNYTEPKADVPTEMIS